MGEAAKTSKASSDAVEEALQKNPPPGSELRGGLLTGWSLVAEWMATDGEKWLSRLDSEGMTKWGREGMFFEALWDWDTTEGDED
jgi:hypothetical protein